MGRGAHTGRWRTAGAVSLAFHVALLAVLAWQLGRQPAPIEAPVINVRLVTLAPRKPAEPPSHAERPRRPIAVRAPRAEPPPSIAPALIAPAPEPSVDPAAAGVARALRRNLGCDHAELMRLSPEERERCERRAAVGPQAPDRRLNLDPSGRYAENPEPYLQRRPTKGCKPRAGGSVDPMGKQGAAAGITCAIPF